jgi:hypothetical protein
MRTRKKELEAISDLLSREHEDVDALAAEVWKLIDSLRRDRELYVVATRLAGGVNMLFGPYESENTAQKDVDSGQIRSVSHGDRYMVMKLLSPSKVFESSTPTLFDIR